MGKDYMSQLSKWARWMLPWQEAENVIADYQDITGIPPRPMEELLRDLGKPRDAVKVLVQPKQYRIWLAMMGIMTVCLLQQVNSPLICPLIYGTVFWGSFFWRYRDIFYCLLLFPIGIITALVWFRRQGRKTERIPKAVLVLLAALLLYLGGIFLLYWSVFRNIDSLIVIWEGAAWIRPEGGSLLQFSISYSCPLLAVAGIYGLIKARTGDRRWAAVYVLAMATILISRMYLELSYIPFISNPEEKFRQFMILCTAAAAVGLAGTGIALC